jgi:hypothetical protein
MTEKNLYVPLLPVYGCGESIKTTPKSEIPHDPLPSDLAYELISNELS